MPGPLIDRLKYVVEDYKLRTEALKTNWASDEEIAFNKKLVPYFEQFIWWLEKLIKEEEDRTGVKK
jgi:hypothetical protein